MSTKHLDVLGLLMMLAGTLELLESTVMGVGVLAAWYAGSTAYLAELGLPTGGPLGYVPVLTGSLVLVTGWILGVLEIGGGYGIYNRRPWGRIVGLIVSIFNILAFPIGTFVGAYGLFVLLNKKLAAEFGAGEGEA